LKIRYSYLAIFVIASLYVPQTFSGGGQTKPKSRESEASINPVEDISSIYSDIDMRMRLATKPNEQACSGDVCASNQLFNTQVQTLGQRLAQSAYLVYPDLKKRTPNFEFSVEDKKALGSASNASGKVVIFRGVQNLDLGDEALSFLIAREMGHVIARHHKSNAKTKLLISALAAVLFPAVSILSASSAATQATTATSVLTSAASTATSYVGSEVALSKIKPSQLTEADDVSIALLEHEGLSKQEIVQALEFIVENDVSTGWEQDLYQSIHYVRQLAGEPKVTTVKLDPLPEAGIAAEDNADASVEKTIQNNPQNQLTQSEQPKPAEERKVILITNESLAESRNQVDKTAKKSLAKKPVAKKSTNKKNIATKNKPISNSKKKKKIDSKVTKKSPPSKLPNN